MSSQTFVHQQGLETLGNSSVPGKERKESRWNGVIDNMDRKLRRGRAEIRDLGAEQFKILRGGKEQKAFHTGEGLPGPRERGDSVGGLGS